MSYADPQSITIGANTVSLPKIEGPSGGKSVYQGNHIDSGSVIYEARLTASHQIGKRVRRVIRLDITEPSVADLYLANVSAPQGMSIYTVFDIPRWPSGETFYDAASQKAVWDGYDALLNASSDVLITKLLNGES